MLYEPKKDIVYVAGAFDLIHYGHVRFLEKAKKLGDILYVGLVTDEGIVQAKGHGPILNYSERLKMLKALRCVDFVIKQDDPYPTEVLQKLKKKKGVIVDILVRSNDITPPIPGQEFIESNGGKIVILPYTKTISSSDIKNRIIKVNKGRKNENRHE